MHGKLNDFTDCRTEVITESAALRIAAETVPAFRLVVSFPSSGLGTRGNRACLYGLLGWARSGNRDSAGW